MLTEIPRPHPTAWRWTVRRSCTLRALSLPSSSPRGAFDGSIRRRTSAGALLQAGGSMSIATGAPATVAAGRAPPPRTPSALSRSPRSMWSVASSIGSGLRLRCTAMPDANEVDASEPTYLFIVGTGRCGSTLVQELIARHRRVGFISNVDSALGAFDLKGGANRFLYGSTPSGLGRRDRSYLKSLRFTLGERVHFGPSEAYKIIRRQIGPTISEPFRDLTEADVTPWLAARCRSFFEERAEAQNASVFMHKFTGWPRARFIDAVMPNARFLHVVRDGRAVASSIVQRPWWRGYLGVPGWGFGELPEDLREMWERYDRSLIVLAGLQWRILMDAFDATAAGIHNHRRPPRQRRRSTTTGGSSSDTRTSLPIRAFIGSGSSNTPVCRGTPGSMQRSSATPSPPRGARPSGVISRRRRWSNWRT